MWTAREGQTQDSRHLVERLARCIVDRAAKRPHIVGDVGDEQETGVPAGDQQCQGGLGQHSVLDDIDGDVGGEVVDPVQRFAQRHCERLGRRHTHQQGPSQPRAGRDRDRVQVIEPYAGLAAGSLDRRNHGLEVGATSDLRHDAAETCMLLDAAGDCVSKQGLAADDPDSGLVAGCLDAKHQGSVTHSANLMICASTSPGW